MRYDKCFVYQCLANGICKGADIESEKFIKTCLDCPFFREFITQMNKQQEAHRGTDVRKRKE